MHNSE